MAGKRTPGPLGHIDEPTDVAEGSSRRISMATPGPIGLEPPAPATRGDGAIGVPAPTVGATVQSQLFTRDASVRDRLNRTLASDGDRIEPGSSGEHVRKIQRALSVLAREPISKTEVEQKFYGPGTANAVEEFKSSRQPPIVNQQHEVDDTVDKRTTLELDRDMMQFERDNPPPPAPLPVVSTADVQVGPLGPNVGVVTSYYQNCALETIGPARIGTVNLRSFTTFEDLFDILLTRAGGHQVIVSHGTPAHGLTLQWCREAKARPLQTVNIGVVAKIAEMMEQGTANKTNPEFQNAVDTAIFVLEAPEPAVLRVAEKLMRIRKKSLILHLRACNLTREAALDYKVGFRALGVSFHSVRLLFLRIKPVRFAAGHSPADVPKNNLPRDRARIFLDSLGELTTLVIDIVDHDGHTNVESFSFVVDPPVPKEIQGWASVLIGKWDGPPTEFVLPVMWDDGERTYHCPLEEGWRQKLGLV